PSTHHRSAQGSRARAGASGRQRRSPPYRAQPLRSAGSGPERCRQDRVEPRRGEPSVHGGAYGSRNCAGGLREGRWQGLMNMRTGFSWTCLLLSAAASLCSCASREADADAGSAKAVRLVAVESATGGGATTYSAVIAPNAQVDLAFRVAGYVVEVRRSKAADGQVRER